MNRIAIIIKGHSNNAEELSTDLLYVDYYKSYLNSIAGGAWEDEETIVMTDPSVESLKELREKCRADYGLIILIGHGANQENNQLFQLNDVEIIKAGQIVLEIPKQLVILESCRTSIEHIHTIDLSDKIPKFKNGGVVRFPIDREMAKDLFWRQVQACDDGLVVCYACSKNEEALNYYFSLVLLKSSFNWHLDPGPHLKTLNILDLMKYLKKLFLRYHKKTLE